MDRTKEFYSYFDIQNISNEISKIESSDQQDAEKDTFIERGYTLANQICEVNNIIRNKAPLYIGSYSLPIIVDKEMDDKECDIFLLSIQELLNLIKSKIEQLREELAKFVENTHSRITFKYFLEREERKKRLNSYANIVACKDKIVGFLAEMLNGTAKAFETMKRTKRYLEKERDIARRLEPLVPKSVIASVEKKPESELSKFLKKHLPKKSEFQILDTPRMDGINPIVISPSTSSKVPLIKSNEIDEKITINQPDYKVQSLVLESRELSEEIMEKYEKVKFLVYFCIL
jgi:hypothetical protein